MSRSSCELCPPCCSPVSWRGPWTLISCINRTPLPAITAYSLEKIKSVSNLLRLQDSTPITFFSYLDKYTIIIYNLVVKSNKYLPINLLLAILLPLIASRLAYGIAVPEGFFISLKCLQSLYYHNKTESGYVRISILPFSTWNFLGCCWYVRNKAPFLIMWNFLKKLFI